MSDDLTQELAARVALAQAEGRPLRIQGGGTKTWLGRAVNGETLALGGHRGILSYEPTELVITARAGTPLAEIQAALAERGQWLAFEPPHFSPADGQGDDPLDAGADVNFNADAGAGADPSGLPSIATLGGTIACGLSGPARPYAGAARDFILGVRLINGKGEVLRFGGEVMKNVAGYDLSRLMAGAQGTLGILLDVSLKVLPRPAVELTLVFEMPAAEAIRRFNQWAGQPLPISGACHDVERAYVRLSGNESAVRAARARLGGEVFGGEALADADREGASGKSETPTAAMEAKISQDRVGRSPAPGADFWLAVRELRHPFFRRADAPLWRLSLPPAAPHEPALGPQFIDWGGAQRWVHDEHPLWSVAQAPGGHASCYGLTCARQDAGVVGEVIADTSATQAPGAEPGPGGANAAVFQPLPPALLALHRRLKAALDPQGILNPGRLYPEL